MDISLREYFEAVEEAFSSERRAPLLLSPLDFEKIVEWHAADISIEVVAAGIADYFERLDKRKVPLRRAICVAFAEDRILVALDAHRVASVGRAAGLGPAEPREVRTGRFLAARAGQLEIWSTDPSNVGAMPLLAKSCAAAAAELRALAERAKEPATRLETVLAPLDREVCRLALLESPAGLVSRWKEEARERLGDLAQGMEPGALRQTMDKLACQSALAHWGLPRISLFFMEDDR